MDRELAHLRAGAAVAVVVLAVPAGAGAATRLVNPEATGSGHRDDIVAAVASARPGDVIALADGAYALPHTLYVARPGTLAAPVTIRAVHRRAAIVSTPPGTSDTIAVQASFVTISGIAPWHAAGLNAAQAAQLATLLALDARGAARRGAWDVGAYEVRLTRASRKVDDLEPRDPVPQGLGHDRAVTVLGRGLEAQQAGRGVERRLHGRQGLLRLGRGQVGAVGRLALGQAAGPVQVAVRVAERPGVLVGDPAVLERRGQGLLREPRAARVRQLPDVDQPAHPGPLQRGDQGRGRRVVLVADGEQVGTD